ncbi:MAG: ABC transporter ATP-binding protein [Patescibacteria group bacterium]
MNRFLRFLPQHIQEAVDVLSWLIREFANQQARRFYGTVVRWALLIKLMEILAPWCLGLVVIAFAVPGSYKSAFVGLGIAHYIRTVADWKASRARERFIGQAYHGLESTLTKKFFSKEIGQHIDEHKLLSRATMDKGRQRASDLIHLATFWFADSLLILVVTLPVLAVISPSACLIVILSIVLGMAISSVSNREVVRKADIVEEENREILADRDDLMDNVERLMMAVQEEEATASFKQRHLVMLSHDLPVWLQFLDVNGFRNMFMTTALLWVTWRAAQQTDIGLMPVGTFISIATWVTIVIAQVNNLSTIERQIMWSVAPLKAMRLALELPPRLTMNPNPITIADNEPITIEFRNVSFRYPDGKLILRNFNLRIAPGEKVALIGKSGSGKSTIGKLILRYMDPTSGVILVNGHDLRDLDLKVWRLRAGQIRQGTQIFTRTLRENLLYGISTVRRAALSDSDLWAFMRRFRTDFGDRLKEGLDTKLGKNGEQISGGEAQRLGILAAVLRNPTFMVIDEATSALDAESQEAVQAALYEALRGRTGAILIAHRLSTTAGCDRIIMMRPAVEDTDEPQIEAIATSLEELATLSLTFRQLAIKEGVLIGA